MHYTTMLHNLEGGYTILEDLEEELEVTGKIAKQAHDEALRAFAAHELAKRDVKDTRRALRKLERAIWIEDMKMEAREAKRKLCRRLPKLPKVRVIIER